MGKNYRPLHITATGTAVPVFPFASTTAATGVTGGTTATITPASMANIYIYEILTITGGTGTAEVVQVLSVTATTFTAAFANSHSGTYNIVAQKPGEIGPVLVGNPGTSAVLTLYNGAPAFAGNTYGSMGSTIGIFALATAAIFYPPSSFLENQLFYTMAGSGFDITLNYLPLAY